MDKKTNLNQPNQLGKFFHRINLILLLEIIALQTVVAQNSSLVQLNNGQLDYTTFPMTGQTNSVNVIPDYSYAGYMGGGVVLPTVPIVKTLSPSGGDDTQVIQNAIDSVEALAPDGNGFRGAILLTAGHYQCDGKLFIEASGVVLRGVGQGRDGTVLHANDLNAIHNQFGSSAERSAFRTNTFIEVQGDLSTGDREVISNTRIETNYVAVGSNSFTVVDVTGFQLGELISIQRTPNSQWINDIEMDAGHIDPDDAWQPFQYEIHHERRIVGIDVTTKSITIDIPIVDVIENQYGGGQIVKINTPGRIQQCGIENLRIESVYANEEDEYHTWLGIRLRKVENSWIKNVTAQHLALAAVYIDDASNFNTVQDCAAIDYKSKIDGGRRYGFRIVDGIGNLIQRSYTRGGRHDYEVGSRVTGPNVYLDNYSTQTYADIGPHQKWSTGTLFDNIRGGQIRVRNRGNAGSGHGWAGNTNMIWNNISYHQDILVESPAGGINWSIGNTGLNVHGQSNNGFIESVNSAVLPRSLYIQQLEDRLGTQAVNNVTTAEQRSGNIFEILEEWQGESDPIATVPFNKILVSEDASIRDGSNATTNYGLSDQLDIKYEVDGENDLRKMLLKFDLSGVSGTQKKARLRFLAFNSGSTNSVPTTNQEVTIRSITDSWSESTVAYSDLTNGIFSVVDSITTDMVTLGVWTEIDITDHFNQVVQGDDILSLIVEETGPNKFFEYRSKESSFAPEIILFDNTSDIDPVANYTFTEAVDQFEFDGTSSSDRDGRIDSYSWDLGDGTIVTDSLVSHTYLSPGIYNVVLTVTDDDANIDSFQRSVRVRAGDKLVVAEDAHVRSGSFETINYGADVLRVKNTTNDAGTNINKKRMTFLKFNLSTTSLSSVDNALLRMKVIDRIDDNNGDYIPTSAVVKVADDTWQEGTGLGAPTDLTGITWLNSPTLADTIVQFSIPEIGEYIYADITEYFNEELQGNGTMSMAVVDRDPRDWTIDFESKESNIGEAPVIIYTRNVIGEAPIASYTFNANKLIHNFDASASTDPDGNIVSYTWDFGDGNTSSGITTNHTYAKVGEYNVTLLVEDNDANVVSDIQQITVENGLQPISDFTYSTTDGALSVDASLSSDPDGTLVNYEWDFGVDGATATGQTSNYTYDQSGTYTVKLTVTDNETNEVESEQQIQVIIGLVPMADFTAIANALVVSFDASQSADSDGGIISYTWDFGDGNTVVTTNSSIEYSYSASNSYIVNLTIQDNDGNQTNFQQTVLVDAGLAPTAVFDAFSNKLRVKVDATSSTDSDGNIVGYQWDFGGESTGYGINATYEFQNAGTYTVTLTTTDDNGNTATSQTAVTVDVQNILSPTDDTYVRGGDVPSDPNDNSNKNFGSENNLVVKEAFGIKNDREVFIKFDLNVVPSVVTAATLRLKANNNNFNGAIHDFYEVNNDGWSEGTLTYNTSRNFLGALIESQDLSTIIQDDWVEVEVKDYFNTEFGDNKIMSLGIIGTNNNPIYASRESGDAPHLVYELSDPDPISSFTFTANFLAYDFDASTSNDPDGNIVTYNWAFGDGNITTGALASHTFAASGAYLVELEVLDNDGNSYSSYQEVQVNNGAVPAPSFSFSVNGLNVGFDGSGTTDVDNDIVSYQWNFGDGNQVTTTIPTTSHNYAATGTYQTTLTVIDARGNAAIVKESFYVEAGAAPIAGFSNQVSLLTVDLDASLSSDADGTIASYAWNFGDGNTATGITATHTYATAGTYTTTLTVTDDDGNTDSDSQTFTVDNGTPPIASFTITPTDLAVAVDASASSDSDGTIVSYAWDYGDGNTGNGISQTHTYASEGTYTITLTVTDNDGNSDNDSDDITVSTSSGPTTVTLNAIEDTYVKGNVTSPLGQETTMQVKDAFGTNNDREAFVKFDLASISGTVSSAILRLRVANSNFGSASHNFYEVNDDSWSETALIYADNHPRGAFIDSESVPALGEWIEVDVTTYVDNETGGLVSFGITGNNTHPKYSSSEDGNSDNHPQLVIVYGGSGPPSNQDPVASFTPTTNLLTVTVDGSASTDSDGTISAYAWDFGDGSTGTGSTYSRTYSADGTYTISLTVTDDDGAQNTTSQSVTVAGPPNVDPVASFTTTFTDLTISTDGTASSDSDGTVNSYAWDYGDGNTGSGATTSHTYAVAGTYTVTLTATDNDGATDDEQQIVTVTSGGPSNTTTLNPTDDAYVRGKTSDQGTNFGNDAKLIVKDASGIENDREVFIKFDLSAIAGATVTSAMLRLRVNNTNFGSATHDFHEMSDDSWTEGGINYTNSRGTGYTDGSLIISKSVPDQGQWIEVEVTSYVAAELTNNQSVSFYITGNNTHPNYNSSESSNPPELVIDYTGGSGSRIATDKSTSSEETTFGFNVYPNPVVSEKINFEFSLREAGIVVIQLFDINGRILDGHNEVNQSGTSKVTLRPKGVKSGGIYFYRINTNEFNKTGKVIFKK